MKPKVIKILLLWLAAVLVCFMQAGKVFAATVDVTGKAKVLNTGKYLDFTSTYLSNVKIDNSTGNFSGYGFSEDIGWVAFGTDDNTEGPVKVNLSTGNVTGRAKELNTGTYLDFTNYSSNVKITLTTGVFSGYVFSTDIGWIDFGDTGVSSGVLAAATTTSSSTGAPGCSDSAPSSAPNLFQIDTTKTTATLYFVTAKEPVTKHYIAYGTGQDNLAYGVEFDQSFSSGVASYTINLLNPNTAYYFKIRGGNGCMPGDWSSVLSAKTKGSWTEAGSNLVSNLNETLTGQDKSLDLSITEQEKESEAKEEPLINKEESQVEQEGIKVTIKVIDQKQQSVAGAKVTLFSEPRTEITDKDGLAYFTNIERGKHTLKIAYQDYEGEEKLDLTGSEFKEHRITVEIKKTQSPVNWLLLTISILLLILCLFLFWLNKRKKLNH